MNSKILLTIISLVMTLGVAACGGSSNDLTSDAADESASLNEQSAGEEGQPQFSMDTQEDNQGAVSIAVTPLNLNSPGETLDFEIAMNTHSVDLSIDLTENAEIITDTGLVVTPIIWNAPQGGHHVSGDLVFPATIDGQSVMEGVAQLTLTIRDVDGAERDFVWELSGGGR